MPLGLDTRLLSLGLLLGVSAVLLPPYLPAVTSFLSNSLDLASHSWANSFHKVQHSVPIVPDYDHEVAKQEPPPIQAMSPVQQRQVKQEAQKVEAMKQLRVPAPIYFYSSDEAELSALDRIKHELTEHIDPRALLIVTSTSISEKITLSTTASSSSPYLETIRDRLHDALVPFSVADNAPSSALARLLPSVPVIHLAVPVQALVPEVTQAGESLHSLLADGIAILVEAPILVNRGKVVDAASHYTGSDRNRVIGSYASSTLLFASAAANDLEGDALRHSGKDLLIRFGSVEEHGPEVM